MTVAVLLLLALSAGLAFALYRARRRIAALIAEDAASETTGATSVDDSQANGTQVLRLRAAAEAVPIGIVVLDDRSDQVFANEAALAVTAPSNGVLAIRLRELLDNAAASPTPIEQDVDLYSPMPRTVRLRATPLLEEGTRLGTVALIEDLTDRLKVEAMRRDFIANASHELKTPLGALRLLAEALVATGDAEVRTKLGARIEGEAARLTRLVDNILDLALIEENRGTPELVDIPTVVVEAVAQTQLLADTLHVSVEQHCADATVSGDHRRLVSAVANLIENAIIHTKAKGLEANPPVEVRVYRNGKDAVIEVEDQGLGIPERHQDRIFERFYRVDQGRSRGSGGTGLGLAIVRHVVQNHGGRIEVESVPGAGATFRLLLPVSED